MIRIKQTKISSITFTSKCPHCDSKKIRRSLRRNFFEKVSLRLLLICPFRCINCNRRFYRFSIKRFRGYASVNPKKEYDAKDII